MSPPLDIASNPEVRELTAQTETLLAVGMNYTIATAADYTVAGVELQRVKAAQKRLEELRKSMTRPIDTAKKVIMDFFRAPEEKLTKAENGIKRSMLAYSQQQEELRREEQRKAEERAAKEQARLQAHAARAAERGEHTKAEAFQDRAATVVAPVIQREAPAVTGISTREVWRFEVVHPNAVPREYLVVDEKKLGQVVRALKGDTNIPGVRVWKDQTIAAGSAA